MQNSQSLPKRAVFQRRRIAPLFILLLLDGFMLGGCVTSWMVRNLLGEKCCSNEPMVVPVYNLLDYLLRLFRCGLDWIRHTDRPRVEGINVITFHRRLRPAR